MDGAELELFSGDGRHIGVEMGLLSGWGKLDYAKVGGGELQFRGRGMGGAGKMIVLRLQGARVERLSPELKRWRDETGARGAERLERFAFFASEGEGRVKKYIFKSSVVTTGPLNLLQAALEKGIEAESPCKK